VIRSDDWIRFTFAILRQVPGGGGGGATPTSKAKSPVCSANLSIQSIESIDRINQSIDAGERAEQEGVGGGRRFAVLDSPAQTGHQGRRDQGLFTVN